MNDVVAGRKVPVTFWDTEPLEDDLANHDVYCICRSCFLLIYHKTEVEFLKWFKLNETIFDYCDATSIFRDLWENNDPEYEFYNLEKIWGGQ